VHHLTIGGSEGRFLSKALRRDLSWILTSSSFVNADPPSFSLSASVLDALRDAIRRRQPSSAAEVALAGALACPRINELRTTAAQALRTHA
jgi:riboflavin biosynthesis pyrimidine reductase